MRLTKNQIEYISYRITKELHDKGLVDIDDPRRMVGAMMTIITGELQVEDRLNEEVREVLIQHSSEMQRSNITYTEMFKMVKRKLAKEKGIVL